MNMHIADMHCDTMSVLLRKKRMGAEEGLYQNTGHLDLKRLRESGYLLQNFALFVNMGKCENPWREVCELHDLYLRQMRENEQWIAPVYAYSDIAANREAGKLSALLTVEEGGVCKGDLEKLAELYQWGVRMLTLTWNYPNEIAQPAKLGEKALGLSETGYAFVEKMEDLGMIVDVSHLSDQGFYDVARVSTKPFVASHSNARSLCGHGRNLTDEMIRTLAEKGGVTGLNFYREFLLQETCEADPVTQRTAFENSQDIQDSVEALIRHAKHIVNVGGMEVLGLGTDFDGIDTNADLPGVQCMEMLWNRMKDAGFNESALDRIFLGNVMRVYKDVLS